MHYYNIQKSIKICILKFTLASLVNVVVVVLVGNAVVSGGHSDAVAYAVANNLAVGVDDYSSVDYFFVNVVVLDFAADFVDLFADFDALDEVADFDVADFFAVALETAYADNLGFVVD